MGDGRAGHRGAPARLAAGAVALVVVAGCTVAGSGLIAPYRSPSLDRLGAVAVETTTGDVLALSPDGNVFAVADPVHGVCLRPVGTNPKVICADLTLDGKLPVTAAFSPDGQRVAVGRDVSVRGNGTAWLVDAKTGKAQPVPAISGPAAASSSRSSAPGASTSNAPPASTYTAMAWNATSGHLLLIGNAVEASGPTTRVVDVDPESLIPRVVALATGPYEFQSGYLATGGSTVIFTVYRGDQGAPNLVAVDLASGVRKEFGPLGPNGTQIVPIAVSPDGRQAVVGSASDADPGAPHLLDLASGALTDISGLTGDFALAAYSPNGAQIALVSQSASTATVAVVPRSAVRVRALSTGRAAVLAGSRLTWSGLDVLSISGSAPPATGSVAGWTLSTR